MNRERAKELLPVIQAFAEGKEIERRYFGATGFTRTEVMTNVHDYEYRIKPEKKVGYLNISTHTINGLYSHKVIADGHAYSERIACIRIEYYEGQFDD